MLHAVCCEQFCKPFQSQANTNQSAVGQYELNIGE